MHRHPTPAEIEKVEAQVAKDAGKPSRVLIYLTSVNQDRGVVCFATEALFWANRSVNGVVCHSGNSRDCFTHVAHVPVNEAGARAFIRDERYRRGFMREQDRHDYERAARMAQQGAAA